MRIVEGKRKEEERSKVEEEEEGEEGGGFSFRALVCFLTINFPSTSSFLLLLLS